ncbi:MAG: type II secretion system protein GspM [Chromatiaceae bacterium]
MSEVFIGKQMPPLLPMGASNGKASRIATFMEIKQNKRYCRLAWALILLTFFAIVTGFGWPWLVRVSALEKSIAESAEKIAHYERVIAALPSLEEELEQERSREDVKAFYYEATTPAVAGSHMQSDLKRMINDAGAQLRSLRTLKIKPEEQHTKISIRAELRCATEPLLDLVYDMEGARPFLFVDRLSVRSHARSTSQRAKSARSRRILRRRSAQGQLSVRLDVSGYALVRDG